MGFKNPVNAQQPRQSAQCLVCLNQHLNEHPADTHFNQITKTVAPLSYDGCARWLVQQQKHRKGSAEGRVLAELLGDAVAALYKQSPLPELLLPVPLHWRRYWSRGHNQSASIANNLARRFSIPVAGSLIKRTRATKAQHALTAKQRAVNLNGAFVATPTIDARLKTLPHGRIAIVDDVVTTGATSNALAQVLQQAGAQEIHLWSPCRAILRQ